MTTEATVASPAELGVLARKPESQAQIAWRSFRRNRLAVVGAVIVLLLTLVAVAGPAITPHDYTAFNRGQPLKPPSERFWFGTDRQTRDVFSRVIVGSRVSL